MEQTEDYLNDEEIQKLMDLLLYTIESPENIHKVFEVISKALISKHMVLSWIPMSTEEIQESAIDSRKSAKLYSEVEDGGVVLSIVENKDDWTAHGQVAFSVISSLVTMVRNDILDSYSDEKIDSYKKFLEYMRESIESALSASTSTDWK
jgi:hypothetical protein